MKLSLKLALLNIRRYPIRAVGSAVCLLIFSFAMFSAALFRSSLSSTVSEILGTRNSGNVIAVFTSDISELNSISECPYILEAFPVYWDNLVSGEITVEDLGEFDILISYGMSPDTDTLVPNTYLEELYALGYENFLVAGRMPERSGEMIICESWLKNQNFTDYNVILGKHITLSHDFIFNEKINDLEDAELVGIFTEDIMDIIAFKDYIGVQAFLLDDESEFNYIQTFCSLDQIAKAYDYFCEKYGGENVVNFSYTSEAIENLLGLNSFVGKLMFLAAGATALVYVLIRLTVSANYIKEKSLFVTATDAFGCGKKHIFGAFAAENIALLIPVSVISGLAASAFVKMILELISAYAGVTLAFALDYGILFMAFAAILIIELVNLLLSIFLLRSRSND